MKIPVPDPEHDEEHATFADARCYAQAVTHERCTYPRGHEGPHQWASHTQPIEVLNGTTGQPERKTS